MSDLAAALVAALKDLNGVTKGRTAKAGSYSYNYADIADVINDTRPVLAKHGLVALTPVHAYEDGLACSVEILHTSGESKTFPPLSFPHGADAQATGSMITYHRRYALLAALGMAAEDDDGAGATERPRAQGNASGRVARGQSAGTGKPTEKQVAFAKALADKLGEAAKSVVPSVIEEVTGSKQKLADLDKADLSKVIDELKEMTEGGVVDVRDKVATAAAATGAEPFGEEPFTDA